MSASAAAAASSSPLAGSPAEGPLPFPPFTQVPTDAVPTSVVHGPDGAYYISQLTGFPFEKGDANIWRVVPGQPATVYASGLTNMTDLAFAPDGSLYAVEISANGLLSPTSSLVWRASRRFTYGLPKCSIASRTVTRG